MADTLLDRNLLFGVLTLQAGLISSQQFVDACSVWAGRGHGDLADLLVERGEILPSDRDHLDHLLRRNLDRHDGNVRESLATTVLGVRQVLEQVPSEAIRQSIASLKDTHATQAKTPTLVSSAVPNRLQRKSLVSEGGLGKVWLAYDHQINRDVALKELRADRVSGDNVRRFRLEAKLTGQLEHPGIVPVHEFHDDQQGNRCFYTMRYVSGKTLSQVVDEAHQARPGIGPPLADLLQLLQYFLNVCQTISYAHSRQVIHRDIKGDNIVVGDFGEVIVLDWGLAKRLDNQNAEAELPNSTPRTEQKDPHDAADTRHGERLGTPGYMSPEQVKGDTSKLDERTDVYGLSAILYEILTGHPPFVGESVDDVLGKVLQEPPPDPQSRGLNVPAELESICLRGLAKDPNQRPQTAHDLAHDVRQWIIQQAERKRSEQERERFFALSPDLLLIVDDQGKIVQFNPTVAGLSGFSPDRLAHMTIFQLLAADGRDQMQALLQSVLKTQQGQSLENRLLSTNGVYRWINWSASLITYENSIYLVGRDVTERRNIEQEVVGILESAPDAMLVIDETGHITYSNQQATRLFQYSTDELLDQPIEILVPEALRPRHAQHVQNYLDDPKPRPMGSGQFLQGRRKDQSIFDAEVSLSPVQSGSSTLVCCAVRDVSQSRKNQRFLQSLLDSAPDAMVVSETSGKIKYINSEITRLFGYPASELLGQPVETLVPESARQHHQLQFQRYVQQPSRRPMGTGQVLQGRHKNGSHFTIDVSLSPIESDDGLLIASAIRPTPKSVNENE